MKAKQFRMKIFSKIIILALCLSGTYSVTAQNHSKAGGKNLIQLSGVISSDLNNPVPFATVHIKNSFRGTIAGVDGFYSLVVKETDTVIYDALGHKDVSFIVPAGNDSQKLIHNVTMKGDTITYAETVVYPWPTQEEFRDAFLSLKVKDTYADMAKKNLDQAKLQELYETLARDGQEAQLYTLQQMANSYYYSGGQKNYMLMGGGVPIPTSLLNPFAWTKFIQDLRAGKFKKK